MPNVLQVDDLIEVKFYGKSEGQFSINVRHYRVTVAPLLGPTDATVAEHMSDAFGPRMAAVMCERAEFLGCSAQIIKPVRRPMQVSASGAAVGTVAGEQLPRQIAGLIKIETNVATRRGRGRFYAPFPGESSNEPDATPNGTYTTNLQLLANSLAVNRTVGLVGFEATLIPVIYARDIDNTTPVQAAVGRSFWATQRRRSDAGGGDKFPF